MVNSVKFSDDTLSKLIQINIEGTLNGNQLLALCNILHYFQHHAGEVKFTCNMRYGKFLQVQAITLESPTPQGLNYLHTKDPLFTILPIAKVSQLSVEVQSNEALDQLIQTLSTNGSLSELTIKNINDAQLLRRLDGVFEQNPHLEKLTLIALPLTQREVIAQDRTHGEERWEHYQSHQLALDPRIFGRLSKLTNLTFTNLAFVKVGLLNILKQLKSLNKFTYSAPGLMDELAKSIRAFAEEWRIEDTLISTSPRRIQGYDISTGKNGVNRLIPPSTSLELLGTHRVLDEENIH